jgi:hypothetical protein
MFFFSFIRKDIFDKFKKKKKKKKLTGGYQRIAANIIFIREIIIAHLLYIIFLN